MPGESAHGHSDCALADLRQLPRGLQLRGDLPVPANRREVRRTVNVRRAPRRALVDRRGGSGGQALLASALEASRPIRVGGASRGPRARAGMPGHRPEAKSPVWPLPSPSRVATVVTAACERMPRPNTAGGCRRSLAAALTAPLPVIASLERPPSGQNGHHAVSRHTELDAAVTCTERLR
jgi:hypothetical protein